MQTFLPLPDYTESAHVLDRQRLGKQRVENLQIAKIVMGHFRGEPCGAWCRHPAVRMWAGNIDALAEYQRAICFEWTEVRGYKDTCLGKTMAIIGTITDPTPPPWFGDPALHAAYRSNLLRKDPDHYGQFGWTEPDDLPYVWPV